MISITSNVDKIIAELEAAKAHLGTKMMPAVMQPQIYLPELREVAERVLHALTQPGEKQYIPGLLDSIIGIATHDGMMFELLATQPEAIGELEPGDVGYRRLLPLEEDIAAWIEEYKTGAGAEVSAYGGDYNKFAAHIMAVIQNDPQSWLRSKNPTGLLAYLQNTNPEAFARVFGLTALPQGRASELLEAVLAYWNERMGVRLVSVAMQEVEKAFA